jgi:hypothetical protein
VVLVVALKQCHEIHSTRAPELPLPRRSHELERKRVQALVNFAQAKE